MQTEPLDTLFDVTYGNKFDLNKMTLLSRADGGVSFVSRSSENHGISATVKEIEGVKPYPAGLITVALGGTKLLSSFVQEHAFYTAQNVAVLKPKVPLTFEQKLYVCLAIRHNRFRYSAFGREANRTIKKLGIPSLANFPSWLGSAVNEAKAPLAAQLLPLKATTQAPRVVRQNQVGTKMVPLSELFDVVYGSNLELNALTVDGAGINFVSRTSKNNGVSAKVKPIDGLFPIEGPVLSVAGGGSVLETFLQLEPFYSGRDLYVLRPKNEMTTDELLFYCCCVRANQ
ncbi:MAG TPA: hypothetical protein VH020_14615 [Stellaceae bacterium]|jgi:hypothetical protein|nr:hypothetical protein [Stellaceae bacterium]